MSSLDWRIDGFDVVVYGLPVGVKESFICSLFNEVAEPQRVILKKAGTKDEDYAIITFRNEEVATNVINILNYTKLDGNPIRIVKDDIETRRKIRSGIGKLIINNLKKDIEVAQLHEAFATFGEIISCEIPTTDGKSRGLGFVQFAKEEDANKAMHDYDGASIDGQTFSIKKSNVCIMIDQSYFSQENEECIRSYFKNQGLLYACTATSLIEQSPQIEMSEKEVLLHELDIKYQKIILTFAKEAKKKWKALSEDQARLLNNDEDQLTEWLKDIAFSTLNISSPNTVEDSDEIRVHHPMFPTEDEDSVEKPARYRMFPIEEEDSVEMGSPHKLFPSSSMDSIEKPARYRMFPIEEEDSVEMGAPHKLFSSAAKDSVEMPAHKEPHQYDYDDSYETYFQSCVSNENQMSNRKERSNGFDVFVDGLPASVSEAFLQSLFHEIAEPQKITLKDKEFKGEKFAIVTFQNAFAAQNVIERLNYIKLDDNPIRIIKADPETKRKIRSGIGKLIIKNLEKDIEVSQLHEAFATFGEVISCEIPTTDGKSRGLGFVQFANEEDANKAIKDLYEASINGQKILIEKYIRQQTKNSEDGRPC